MPPSVPTLCPPCGKSNALEPHSGHGEAQSSPPRFSFTPRGRFEHFRHVKGSSKERPWIVRVENVLKPSAASRCQGKAVETSLGLLPNPFRVRERGFRLFRGCKSHLALCTSHSALLSCPLNLFSCLAPRALVYHAKGVTLPLRPPCARLAANPSSLANLATLGLLVCKMHTPDNRLYKSLILRFPLNTSCICHSNHESLIPKDGGC